MSRPETLKKFVMTKIKEMLPDISDAELERLTKYTIKIIKFSDTPWNDIPLIISDTVRNYLIFIKKQKTGEE
jgi:hypothetical protein